MRPCFQVEIETPKGVLLNGLWFGPKKAKRGVIWIHGLNSSAFSKLDIVEKLVDSQTAVLTFNNRGHDMISRLVRTPSKKSGIAGGGAEKFIECKDDIDGAIKLLKSRGIKQIFIAGHSTGCQKSVYWASKSSDRAVKGILLLAPVSDYAAAVGNYGKKKIQRVVTLAKRMIHTGRGDEIIPLSVWAEEVCTAQRYVSLYTQESVEEIFSYSDPKKRSILKKVTLPICAIFAENDEFAGAIFGRISNWFEKNLNTSSQMHTIHGANHSFSGGENKVAQIMKEFMKDN